MAVTAPATAPAISAQRTAFLTELFVNIEGFLLRERNLINWVTIPLVV
jgi:hypothetical protein